jgi:ribosome biogenesis GTPase
MLSISEPSQPASLALQGIVFKKSQGLYTVRAADPPRTVPCAISNRLRKVLLYPTAAPTSLHHRVQAVKDIRELDPVAVGDRVAFTDAGDGTGLITEVLPRRNALSRRAAFDHGGGGRTSAGGEREQVIVANVDQIVAVLAAAQPAPKWNLLDRYLAAAETSGIPTLICLSKADLLEEPAGELQADVEAYRRLGYPVALVSAATGAGVAEFRERLRDRMSIFIGKSGVGKTTLLNALQPGLGLRVKAVNQVTGKGKHTTTHLEMFDLDFGGQVVDTPGMREFGLWKMDGADLAHAFVEFRPYLGRCRFGADCTHAHEPGCAVKAAVEAGQIAPRRYDSYLRMWEDQHD